MMLIDLTVFSVGYIKIITIIQLKHAHHQIILWQPWPFALELTAKHVTVKCCISKEI